MNMLVGMLANLLCQVCCMLNTELNNRRNSNIVLLAKVLGQLSVLKPNLGS